MLKRNVTYHHNVVTGKNSGFKDNATRPNWRKVAAAKALNEAKEKEKASAKRAESAEEAKKKMEKQSEVYNK